MTRGKDKVLSLACCIHRMATRIERLAEAEEQVPTAATARRVKAVVLPIIKSRTPRRMPAGFDLNPEHGPDMTPAA